jgi:hypothetical protein
MQNVNFDMATLPNGLIELLARALDDVEISAELAVAHWADYQKWLARRQHSPRTRTEYAAYLGASKHVDPSKVKRPSYS